MEQAVQKNVRTGGTEGVEGKYLTFILCDEEYGLEILKVREIICVVRCVDSRR